MAQENKYTGVCKWFNSGKGYGFISLDDGSGDVFVHQTEIHAQGYRSLAEGEKLEFEVIEENDGRRKAKNVTGPNGDYVKGQPRQQNRGYGGGNGGYGGGGGYGGNNGGYGGNGGGGYNNNRRGGYGGGYGGGNSGYRNNNYNNNNYNSGGGGGGYNKGGYGGGNQGGQGGWR